MHVLYWKGQELARICKRVLENVYEKTEHSILRQRCKPVVLDTLQSCSTYTVTWQVKQTISFPGKVLEVLYMVYTIVRVIKLSSLASI